MNERPNIGHVQMVALPGGQASLAAALVPAKK